MTNASAPLTVTEAVTLIRAHMTAAPVERVPLGEAAGRILRADVQAERDQPPHDRVMMDGIAIRHGAPETLRIIGTQRAGMAALTLADPATCIETMTGGILPHGADTIIPVERLTRDPGMARIEAGYSARPGQFIHRQASDCRAGDTLLRAGLRLHAPAIAVLAGNGYADVMVSRRPSIAIVTTGDELVPVEGPVKQWEIRRSNEYAIAAALTLHGYGNAERLWAPDDLEATRTTLEAALTQRDVVILSGGVSMGDFDYVPQALRRLGVRQIFHKVAQKPGRPLWFGIGPQGQAVFALPGSPVSAVMCLTRYVLPALDVAQGTPQERVQTMILTESVSRLPGMTRFVPARLGRMREGQPGDGLRGVTPLPVPTSGDFSHLGETDGLIDIPPGPEDAPAGTQVFFHGW